MHRGEVRPLGWKYRHWLGRLFQPYQTSSTLFYAWVYQSWWGPNIGPDILVPLRLDIPPLWLCATKRNQSFFPLHCFETHTPKPENLTPRSHGRLKPSTSIFEIWRFLIRLLHLLIFNKKNAYSKILFYLMLLSNTQNTKIRLCTFGEVVEDVTHVQIFSNLTIASA
jgi:hypothetical protein